MDWISQVFWLLLAVVLIIVEAITFNLITIWFAIGAIAALIVALFIPNFTIQIIVFIVVSILVLITIRDFAVKKLIKNDVKTNVSALIGKKAIVTRKIEEYNNGEVKIEGNYWTAKSVTGETIEEKDIVEIMEISGVKLLVKKIQNK